MSDMSITESIDIPSPAGPVCRVYHFESGHVVLAFDRPGVTLRIHLSADEARALGEALPRPALDADIEAERAKGAQEVDL